MLEFFSAVLPAPSPYLTATTTTTAVLWPVVWEYPAEPVPEENTHPLTYPDHHTIFISFFHLLQSSLFNLRAWQSFCTTSLLMLLVTGKVVESVLSKKWSPRVCLVVRSVNMLPTALQRTTSMLAHTSSVALLTGTTFIRLLKTARLKVATSWLHGQAVRSSCREPREPFCAAKVAVISVLHLRWSSRMINRTSPKVMDTLTWSWCAHVAASVEPVSQWSYLCYR